jgi:hypothetical protein
LGALFAPRLGRIREPGEQCRDGRNRVAFIFEFQEAPIFLVGRRGVEDGVQPASSIFKPLLAGEVIGDGQRHVQKQLPIIVGVYILTLKGIRLWIGVQMHLHIRLEQITGRDDGLSAIGGCKRLPVCPIMPAIFPLLDVKAATLILHVPRLLLGARCHRGG